MRIAIVNDTATAAELLRRIVHSAPSLQVAWIARDGEEAVRMCGADRPDLILMDLIMPRMDGVEATRRIMAQTPCAILIVTASVEDNARLAFAAMGNGALDAVDLPLLDADPTATARPMLAKISVLSRLIGDWTTARSSAAAPSRGPVPLVAIGASAGGPAALATLLSGLPRDFPAAIVIIQHVDERFAAGMADWLDQHSSLPVRLAREGDALAQGQVLLAGTADHLAFKSHDRLGYSALPDEEIYRPSVNVFFRSICKHRPNAVTGVLLTGMGSDGALGLKALRDRGHHTIAQDRASSAVYGMPKAAAAHAAAVEILPLDAIAGRLTKLLAACPATKEVTR